MVKSEELEQYEMTMVAYSGMARSNAFEAMKFARLFEFGKAEKKIEEAKENTKRVQEVHVKLLKADADGEISGIGVILAHGLDHFMSAQLAGDMAEEMIEVYKLIKHLKEKKE